MKNILTLLFCMSLAFGLMANQPVHKEFPPGVDTSIDLELVNDLQADCQIAVVADFVAATEMAYTIAPDAVTVTADEGKLTAIDATAIEMHETTDAPALSDTEYKRERDPVPLAFTGLYRYSYSAEGVKPGKPLIHDPARAPYRQNAGLTNKNRSWSDHTLLRNHTDEVDNSPGMRRHTTHVRAWSSGIQEKPFRLI